MEIVKILTGHTSRKTAFVVIDSKFLRQRTTKYVWIETKPGFGDRLAWQALHPKTGELSKINYNKFCVFAFLFLDEKGLLHDEVIPFDESGTSNQKRFADLMMQIDPSKLSYEQQYHIRKKIYEVFLANSIYEQKKLAGEQLEQDRNWMRSTLLHIETCPFDQIAGYPPFKIPQDWPITFSLRYDDSPLPLQPTRC
jgi:hypothetical protein